MWKKKCGMFSTGILEGIPRRHHSMKVQFVVKGLAVDAEQFGGLRHCRPPPEPGHGVSAPPRRPGCRGWGAAADSAGDTPVPGRSRQVMYSPGDSVAKAACSSLTAGCPASRRRTRAASGFAVEIHDPFVQLAVGLVEEKNRRRRYILAHLPHSGHACVNSLIRW